jgi:hypothetical protein
MHANVSEGLETPASPAFPLAPARFAALGRTMWNANANVS